MNTRGVGFRRAYKKEAKLIVIDPRKNFYAKKADLYLQPRPGTDAALALGFFNVIIEEGLYDKEFVAKYIHGWDAFVEKVREYPLPKVERITWVGEDLIREAARVYAAIKPAAIHWGVSTEQTINCTDYTRTVTGLMAVTGNLDVPGGNVFHMPPKIRGVAEFSCRGALSPAQREKRLGGEQYKLIARMSVVTPRAAWDALFTLSSGLGTGSSSQVCGDTGKSGLQT